MGVSELAQLVVPEREADYPSVDRFGWLPAFDVHCATPVPPGGWILPTP
ncbi:hypothetical protein LBMAG56_23880 [Verrucomicrobiota bacterium]|nr:hypothetical protein LBMAG56_23880 [Verrucomicrobiota bacterium]